jgi:hypothetical protein
MSNAQIKIFLTEKEIISPNCDRLVALFANQDASGLKALHQSVALVLPKRFSCRYEMLSFEHPEVRAFSSALLSKLPGLSFFLHLDSPRVFKQLLFATLPSITITRRDGKALVALPKIEFTEAIEREIHAAANLARKAGFPVRSTEQFSLGLKSYFDGPRYR